MYLEKAKPSAGDAGFAAFVKGFPASDDPHHSQNLDTLQAFHLRRRFGLSAEIARVVASLAFGRAPQ